MRHEEYPETRESATFTRCRSLFARERSATWRRLCVCCYRAEQDRAAYERGWREGHAAAMREAPGAILLDRLRQLLQLAHPDRHGGSALATNTTAWMLAQRHVWAEAAR